MFNVQVSMDQHIRAFEWLEDRFGNTLFLFGIDEGSCMIEQVTAQKEIL